MSFNLFNVPKPTGKNRCPILRQNYYINVQNSTFSLTNGFRKDTNEPSSYFLRFLFLQKKSAAAQFSSC